MSNSLFNEFNPVSEIAWKQKIQADLKGADYNQTLITPIPGGINIKPIYHRDSTTTINTPKRSNQTWHISQRIYAANAAAANTKAQDALKRGAQGILIIIPHNKIDPNTLLNALPDQGIQIHPMFMDLDYIDQIYKIKPHAYIHLDIIHQLASDGNWYHNTQKDIDQYQQFIQQYPSYFAQFTVNTTTYQQAGATVTQELAYYAAHLNEYLNYYCNTDQNYNEAIYNAFAKASKRINIDTSIGTNYFIEIAKYRAYRIITKTIGKLYNLDLQAYITASPSLRNKSLMDYNVNLLRTTTECMSAILGTADTVYNLPYDAFFNKENEFAERIARNQLLILKEEAYLDKVNNPADGSYYIDTLTKQLTDESIKLFKTIEQAGGFIQSLFNGTIQRKIKQSASQQLDDFNTSNNVLVGVNKYPNTELQLQQEYELYPFVKTNKRKTLIQPIIPSRIAESYEKAQMS